MKKFMGIVLSAALLITGMAGSPLKLQHYFGCLQKESGGKVPDIQFGRHREEDGEASQGEAVPAHDCKKRRHLYI